MTAQQIIKANELVLRKFFEKYMLDTYKIKLGTGREERIIFDFHNPVNELEPVHSAVFLTNKRAGYTDLVGFLEFDFADYEFIFYPKRNALKITISC